jgi:hypothetical protein
MIPGLGTVIGGLLGGVIGTLIGRMIAKAKPRLYAELSIGEDGLVEAIDSHESGKVSEAMRGVFDKYGDAITGAINGFVASMGGTFESMGAKIEIAMREGFFRVIVDGVVHKFGEDFEAAILFAMEEVFKAANITDSAGEMIDAIGEFDAFVEQARLLGIDLAQAAMKGAQGILEARLQIEQNKARILTDLSGVMEKAGMNTGILAEKRAEIEQKIFLITVKKLEAEMIAFGLMDATLQKVFDDLSTFAETTANFSAEAEKVGQKADRRAAKRARKQAKQSILDELRQIEMGDFEYALFKLNVHWAALAKQAKKLGISEERVSAAREKAIEQLKDQFLKPLTDLREQIMRGPTVLLGAQYSALQSDFASAQEDLATGNLDAAADVAQIGQDLIALAAQIFGTSSAAYQALVDMILGVIEGAVDSADGIVTLDEELAAAQLAATNSTTYAIDSFHSAANNHAHRSEDRQEGIKYESKKTKEEVIVLKDEFVLWSEKLDLIMAEMMPK